MTELQVQELMSSELADFTDLILEIFGRHKRELANTTFADTFSDSAVRPHILVAKLDRKIIGGVVITPIRALSNDTTFGISWLCVVPEHRGKGYSTVLMNDAEIFVKDRLLDGNAGDLILSTAVGDAFYERRGYQRAYARYDNIGVLVKHVQRNK